MKSTSPPIQARKIPWVLERVIVKLVRNELVGCSKIFSAPEVSGKADRWRCRCKSPPAASRRSRATCAPATGQQDRSLRHRSQPGLWIRRRSRRGGRVEGERSQRSANCERCGHRSGNRLALCCAVAGDGARRSTWCRNQREAWRTTAASSDESDPAAIRADPEGDDVIAWRHRARKADRLAAGERDAPELCPARVGARLRRLNLDGEASARVHLRQLVGRWFERQPGEGILIQEVESGERTHPERD